MAMSASRVEVEADVEEEENFGPQPLSRLEVREPGVHTPSGLTH